MRPQYLFKGISILVIILFLFIFYNASAWPSENFQEDFYEPGELGLCTECHRQVYPLNTKDFAFLKRKIIEVNHGKDEQTIIYYNDKKNVLYLWIKDNEYFYLLPSKITDNPHIIK